MESLEQSVTSFHIRISILIMNAETCQLIALMRRII